MFTLDVVSQRPRVQTQTSNRAGRGLDDTQGGYVAMVCVERHDKSDTTAAVVDANTTAKRRHAWLLEFGQKPKPIVALRERRKSR